MVLLLHPIKVTFYARTERKNLDFIEFYSQDIRILKDLGYEVVVATRLREINWNSSILFIWWWTHALVPTLIGRLLGMRVVITGTFNFRAPGYIGDFYDRNIIQRILIRQAMRWASANILVSQRELDLISAEWHYKNLFYAPHIVDTDYYRPSRGTRGDYLFCIAGLTPGIVKRKCIYELLDAIRILVDEGHVPKLLLAGRLESETRTVQDYITLHKLSHYVSILGEISQDEKLEHFQNCALYVQPTRYEGFGLAIAEAMSCGSLVLSTNVGAVPEVVGDAGILTVDCSPESIAQSINRIWQKKSQYHSMHSAARKRIEDRFPYSRRLNDLKKILNNQEHTG